MDVAAYPIGAISTIGLPAACPGSRVLVII
jgi:hypothetical protein